MVNDIMFMLTYILHETELFNSIQTSPEQARPKEEVPERVMLFPLIFICPTQQNFS